MKKATGIVLDEQVNLDYSIPASFRIIVLLETLSKILKGSLPFVLPQLPTPLASYTPNSVGLCLVWAALTLLLPSPTKCAYFKLLPSKYQLSS